MEASEKLDIIQRRTRAQAKQEDRESRTRQSELFAADEHVLTDDGIDSEEVKAYWMRRLDKEQRFGVEQLADMLEETGWFESDFQAAFGQLAREGKAANLDDTKKRRRTKYVHFNACSNQGEKLIRLKR